ncbi:phosphomannose isomerase type II C-terminal cupin domain [Leptolyngbya sp. 7M]|uniref:phosphomannose isomerase type II C-terminal cupin domain n=1 Tax=Leptolyngbya sp. 7M TaxID=2812896 RepID=UPI001B8BFE70|nr:phosphomannose isomerase type II C-terminal cupin domain [Leptolyngbya sp. 7M]QYO66209.1 phosphomannose isomerase type II C-terminal cupin domain [Leptolyngbya sp. 7M]
MKKNDTLLGAFSEQRPWGSFTILDEDEDFKVKRIEVLPLKRLSYQRHSHRSEHWFVVRGKAKVTLNGEEILVGPGESIDITAGSAHRVENSDPQTKLVFIETQTGSYFGEDDIERLEDDFGRADI